MFYAIGDLNICIIAWPEFDKRKSFLFGHDFFIIAMNDIPNTFNGASFDAIFLVGNNSRHIFRNLAFKVGEVQAATNNGGVLTIVDADILVVAVADVVVAWQTIE